MNKLLILAPMASIGHRAQREIIERFGGCSEYFSEMISASAMLAGSPYARYYLDSGPRPDLHVFQLTGADERSLSLAASELDVRDCKGIDINMGCSAPEITRMGAGVRWMDRPEEAVRTLRIVRNRVRSKRLSVKIRLGSEVDAERLVSFGKMIQDAGVEMITLHPRTASQKFKRKPAWDFVDLLSRELRIPVIGNGDIGSALDAISRLSQDNSGVMIGRQAVREPWIFTMIRAETARIEISKEIDLEDIFIDYLDLLTRYQPLEFHSTRMKRFCSYYCDNFIWGNYLKAKISVTNSLSDAANTIKNYLKDHPDERRKTIVSKNSGSSSSVAEVQ